MKKRLLAIILPIVVLLAIGGAVFAAATPSKDLDSKGSLTVYAEEGLSIIANTTNLTWTGGPVKAGQQVTLTSSSVTLTNNGNIDSTGLTISPANPTVLGVSGWTLAKVVDSGNEALAVGDPVTIHFTLTGNAPSTSKVYDLSPSADPPGIPTITVTAH